MHHHTAPRNRRVFASAMIATAAFLVLALCARAQASAFEQAGTFAASGEEVQLGGLGAMAVNVDGAGGVPAGSVYALTFVFGELRVSRFAPMGEGLELREGWEVVRTKAQEEENVGEGKEPYPRCGKNSPSEVACPTSAEDISRAVGLAIDQATGNVYVFNGEISQMGVPVIAVFRADGSEVITRFGEVAEATKTTAETPTKIHESPYPSGIAVNDEGEVYVFDVNSSNNFYHRLMVFKPKTAGKFDEYEYAGTEQDIGAGFLGESHYPTRPVIDDAGNVYGTDESFIEAYDPEQPKTPTCQFKLEKGGITAMTVNPETGEPFFYTYKDQHMHQMGPCEGGVFKERGEFGLTPNRGYPRAMAFDPKRQIGSRPVDALYAGVPAGNIEKGNSLGFVFAPVEENAPAIVSESVSSVGSASARLEAAINPKGFATRYIFQYLTTAAYKEAGESFAGASEAPVGEAALGSGQLPLAGAVSVSGLQPDTPYTYRVVARSHCAPGEEEKVCESDGPGQEFQTFAIGVGQVPDARAYELVSPAQKNGGQVFPADPLTSSCGLVECKPGGALHHFPMQSAPNGESIVYEGNPFSPSEGTLLENEYIARRDNTSGWQTVNLTPPALVSKGGQGYKDFSTDLATGVLEQVSPALSAKAPAGYDNLYTQPTANPLSLSPLLTKTPPHGKSGEGAESLFLRYGGASADLSRVFFEANDELEGLGDGGVSEETNLYESVGGELHLVSLGPLGEVLPGSRFGSGSFPSDYIVSSDGARTFWTSKAGQLYVRIAGTETVAIPGPGKFLSAAADGTRVLLDDGSIYGQLAGGAPVKEADLTAGKGGFQGLVGQSEDLTDVYFIDTAVLDEEENEQGEKAQAGKPNLYAYAKGTTTYIATLLAADNANGSGDWAQSPLGRTAEASPAGRYLAFLSMAALTGYDNTGPCEINGLNEALSAPCAEAFLYDSVTGELSCPSCNSSGSLPLGPATLRVNPGVGGAPPQPRYLLDSGRLYFDSGDSLVPTDTNHGSEDVYQFEPQGVGGCKHAAGCVSMLSAGRELADSNFLATDQSGDNVFFTTRDRLVKADTDELVDLYDARVGGGFGFESQPPPLPCQGEGCQPPPPPQPEAPPPSQNLKGLGNVSEAPKKCRKGRVRRGNRCVKKHHHRAKRRAAHKRGGAR